jgi:hypothetical protein
LSGNTVPRDYVVTIRLQKLGQPPSPEDPIERVEVIAYEFDEATMSALFSLDARIGGIRDHGLLAVVLNVEPNCKAAADRTGKLLKDVLLSVMPSRGRG